MTPPLKNPGYAPELIYVQSLSYVCQLILYLFVCVFSGLASGISYSMSLLSSFHRMPKMKWSLQHDTIFRRELLGWEVWKNSSDSRERENCFEEICKILNNIKEPQICVSKKSLKDRLKILERDCKARKRERDRGSGISPEYRETDQIMRIS